MAKKMGVTLFNPQTTPVVCDGEGRIVDGGGRRTLDRLDEVGEKAVADGLLVREEDEQRAEAEQPVESKRRPTDKESGASATSKSA